MKISVRLAPFVLALLLGIPLLSHAQSTTSAQADLSATIRAQLLSDPRTSSLTQAQLDAMVSLLTQQAQKQGVTSQDIQWRPQETPQSVTPVAADAGTQSSDAISYVVLALIAIAVLGAIWAIATKLRQRTTAKSIPPPAL